MHLGEEHTMLNQGVQEWNWQHFGQRLSEGGNPGTQPMLAGVRPQLRGRCAHNGWPMLAPHNRLLGGEPTAASRRARSAIALTRLASAHGRERSRASRPGIQWRTVKRPPKPARLACPVRELISRSKHGARWAGGGLATGRYLNWTRAQLVVRHVTQGAYSPLPGPDYSIPAADKCIHISSYRQQTWWDSSWSRATQVLLSSSH